MESPLTIRRAEPGDAAALEKVLRESFAEFETLYTPGGFAATTPTAEQILVRIQEGPCWVAMQGYEAIGTVAALVKEQSVYVRGMAVIPDARGTGVARKLLDTVEQYASIANCRRLYLSTTPFLNDAIRLYEKYGFRRTVHATPDLFGTPLFTMEKMIPSPK